MQLFDICLLAGTEKIAPNKQVRMGIRIPQNLLGGKYPVEDGITVRHTIEQNGNMLLIIIRHRKHRRRIDS